MRAYISILILFAACCCCHSATHSTGEHTQESNHVNNNVNTLQVNLQKSSVLPDEPTSFFRENSLDTLFNGEISFDDYLTYSMRAVALVSGFDNDLHRYDSKIDLINSFSRNLSYTDDLGQLKAHIDPSEVSLLNDQSELTLLENERNQALCGEQLEFLIEQVQALLASFQAYSSSKKLDLIEFLDSYGAPMDKLMKGNLMWYGSYEQCGSSKLHLPASRGSTVSTASQVGGRYCVANFRSPLWPVLPGVPADRLGSHSIKLGVCLPETCNSISILRHRARLEKLIKLVRLNQIPFSHYKLVHLFCLPDQNSPLRQFNWSARIFIIILSCWTSLVMYFSLKYEWLRIKWLHSMAISEQDSSKLSADAKQHVLREQACESLKRATSSRRMQIFALRLSLIKLFDSPDTRIHVSVNKTEEKPCKSTLGEQKTLPIGENLPDSGVESSDSDSSSSSSTSLSSQREDDHKTALKLPPCCKTLDSEDVKTKNMLEALKVSPKQFSACLSTNLTSKTNVAVVAVNSHQSQPQAPKSVPSVDLGSIDGIKVISMIWLISAHTLLFFIRTIANQRDFWSILRDARFMTVMAGIFPVDSFFTITGILMGYLKFNKNDGQAMKGVKFWLEAFMHRYLRFMPMYLLVFWYTRDVSEYIGSGPLWDYGTASTSLRSVCKQESALVPILFQANFKPLDQHCVKPAWYLANDYQYLLITPIFMGLIMKSTLLGYSAIVLSVIASVVLQFLTVFYSTELDDFGALINFKPMFATYVLKNLWKLYVLPYNRIPPYLIGVLTGHLMYTLNKSSRKPAVEVEKTTIEGKSKGAAFDSQHSLTTHRDSSSDILSSEAMTRAHGLTAIVKNYICFKVWTPLVILISIIYFPMLTKLATQEGLAARIGTSSIIAFMRLVWSLAVARLIYVCSTRAIQNNKQSSLADRSDSFIIRFLSSPKWKPWSKIGLTALLIQWEIISYFAQMQSSTPNMTITFLLAAVLISIVSTYVLALLIYLILEYPLSQVEQLYFHPIFFSKR